MKHEEVFFPFLKAKSKFKGLVFKGFLLFRDVQLSKFEFMLQLFETGSGHEQAIGLEIALDLKFSTLTGEAFQFENDCCFLLKMASSRCR